jgi:hypothetical protein
VSCELRASWLRRLAGFLAQRCAKSCGCFWGKGAFDMTLAIPVLILSFRPDR